MSFLPQEFCGSEEEAGTHFPTHHVCPLVAKNRQVAVRLDPITIGVPDNCLGCRTDNQFFFQLGGRIDYDTCAVVVCFQTIMRYNGTFFGEAFHMLGFLAQE